MLAARAEFLVLMRDYRIDAVLEPHLWPDPSALLPLQQFGVQHAGIDDRAHRVRAALSLVRIEGSPPAVTTVIRLPDLMIRDAEFLHAPADVALAHVLPFL